MLNPKEAAEDGYALNMAILFFAGCAVLMTVYFSFDSGLKYWILKGFGETSNGSVISIEKIDTSDKRNEAIHESSRNALKNMTALQNDVVTVQFKPAQSPVQTTEFKVPENLETGTIPDIIPITYLPANPNIAYPADYLSNFSFDGKALFWSLLIGLIIVFLAVRSARKWASFRKGLRRY